MNTRIDKDQLGLLLALAWSQRGTCPRRRVGAVLWDARGRELATGYNGPPAGEPHCDAAHPCPGFGAASGESLALCEAVHAEVNAVARCRDPDEIHTCYAVSSPCLDCVKLLLNTGCRRIVFAEKYAHDGPARSRWLRRPGRTWEHVPMEFAIVQGGPS